MKTNPIAKTLQIIGWALLILAIVALTAINTVSELTDNTIIIVLFTTFIVCMTFEGFAEIIELLYINGKKQETIIDFLYLSNAKQDEVIKLLNDDASKNSSAKDFEIVIDKK